MITATVGIPNSPYEPVPVKAYAGIPIAQQPNGDFYLDPLRWGSNSRLTPNKTQVTILGQRNLNLLEQQLPNRQVLFECSIGGSDHDNYPVLHDPSGLDDGQLLLFVCGYEYNENNAVWKQLSSENTYQQSGINRLVGHPGQLQFFDSLWVLEPAQPLQLRFWTGQDRHITVIRWVNWDGKTISIWEDTFWNKLNEESQHQQKIASFMTDPEHHFADFYVDL